MGYPFGVSLCFLWSNRNDVVFWRKMMRPTNRVRHIISVTNCISRSRGDHGVGNCNLAKQNHSLIRWNPPLRNWVKLKCDGVVSNLGVMAAIGGCALDDKSNFVFGYSPAIRPNSPILFLAQSSKPSWWESNLLYSRVSSSLSLNQI